MAVPKELYFCTGNGHKFLEISKMMDAWDFKGELIQADLDVIEPRGESFGEIAADCARQAFARLKKPVFVEDSGLEIKALNGFPSVYSSWVFKKLGNEGILKLLAGRRGAARAAEFVSYIAYKDGKDIKTFNGICKGVISLKPRGTSGFGYDPVFQPQGTDRTFAELGAGKQSISHRSIALRKFMDYLSTR